MICFNVNAESAMLQGIALTSWVEPLEKVRPAAAYMLTIDDVKEFPKYEKLWKEIFQLR